MMVIIIMTNDHEGDGYEYDHMMKMKMSHPTEKNNNTRGEKLDLEA